MLAMFYLVLIIVFVTLLLQSGQPLDAEGRPERIERTLPTACATAPRPGGRIAAALRRRAHRVGRVLIYARAAVLGVRLPVPDLLDGHDLVQDRRSTSPRAISSPGSTSSPTGGAGARSACRRTRSAQISTVRDEFLKRFTNSIITSVGASVLAIVHRLARRLRAQPLPATSSAWMRNKDISFFFLSQLILPPVVLALPFLVLYKELALLDTRIGPDPALHADGAADRHLDHARPVRHDPDRARAGRARRRLLDLGRLLPHRAADRAAGHGGGLHPLASCCAGTSISSRRC